MKNIHIILIVLTVLLPAYYILASAALSGITDENDCVSFLQPDYEFKVSCQNGEVVSGRMITKSIEVFGSCSDFVEVYNENIQSGPISTIDDKVVKKDLQNNKLILDCNNPKLEIYGLSVCKAYSHLGDGSSLAKNVTIKNNGKYGFFVRWNTGIKLTNRFVTDKDTYFYSPMLFPQVWVRDVKQPTPVASQYYGAFRNMMCSVVNPATEVYGASYIYKVRDNYNYFRLCQNSSDLEGFNNMILKPDGWEYPTFLDYIGAGQSTTFEMEYTIGTGDSTAVFEHLMNLPARTEIEKTFKPCSWAKDVSLIQFGSRPMRGYLSDNAIMQTKRMAEKIGRGYLLPIFFSVDMRSGMGVPGVYGWDIWSYDYSPNRLLNEQHRPDPNWFMSRLHKFWSEVPETKTAEYIWLWTQPTKYRNEWMVTDKNGSVTTRFGMKQITIPEVREHYKSMMHEFFEFTKHPVIYLDAGNMYEYQTDWGHKKVAQFWDWFSFYKDIIDDYKKIVPDGLVFLNGPMDVYCDGGFQEVPGVWTAEDWRIYSDALFLAKDSKRGDSWGSILYWPVHSDIQKWKREDRRYFNALFLGGLKANLPLMYGHETDFKPNSPEYQVVLAHLPYIQASYELKDAEIINADICPNWRREQTTVDAYVLKQGNTGIIWSINNAKDAEKTDCSVSTIKMGMNFRKPVYGWVFRLKDVTELSLDRKYPVCTETLKFIELKAAGYKINFSVPAKYEELRLITFSQTPAFVYSDGNIPCHLRLGNTIGIALEGDYNSDKTELQIKAISDNRAQIMLLVPEGMRVSKVSLNGKELPIKEITEAGCSFVLADIEKGQNDILARFASKK